MSRMMNEIEMFKKIPQTVKTNESNANRTKPPNIFGLLISFENSFCGCVGLVL